MNNKLDMIIVFIYFAIVLFFGGKISRKHKKDSAEEYLTGGKQMNWFRTSMTLIATSINVGIIGFVGIGFVWGMAIQPNAVNLWFAAPFTALFFLPIYWRTKIVTTPQLLEKRFNVSSRTLFSLLMTFLNVVNLGTSLYLGGYMFEYFFGWNLYLSCLVIVLIVAFLNLTGGMKAILAIDFYQGIFISVTFLIIGAITLYRIGGITDFLHIKILSEAQTPLPSLLLPFDLSPSSLKWYAMPIGLIWAILAGTSWMACNFNMVQRLLAARNEKQAQKAVIFTAFGNVLACFIAYFIGISVRALYPELVHPDQAYLVAIMNFLPVGFRGLIIVGMTAALVSSINGMTTSTTSLFVEDIYLRFIKPTSNSKSTKQAARFAQVTVLILSVLLIPLAAKEKTITRLIQDLVSMPLGIMISLFGLGVFSTKITPKAALLGAVIGILVSLVLFFFYPTINFWNRGVIGSATVIIVAILLSFFEKKQTIDQLENLTIFTVKGANTPFIGTLAWKNILWWIGGIQILWVVFTIAWEMLIL